VPSRKNDQLGEREEIELPPAVLDRVYPVLDRTVDDAWVLGHHRRELFENPDQRLFAAQDDRGQHLHVATQARAVETRDEILLKVVSVPEKLAIAAQSIVRAVHALRHEIAAFMLRAPGATLLVFPAKAGIYPRHGHRPSPV